jgi:hypothetical protein
MAKRMRCLFHALFFSALLLNSGKRGEAKTAKTCPDCACIFLDAAGKQSATPVPILVRPGADATNDFNYGYEVKSDPAAKKACQGKQCNCRIIKRTTEVVKGEKQVSDQVVSAGKGANTYRLGAFKKAEADAKKKGGGVELLPACVLLGEDGDPEYGQPHEREK